MTELSTKPAHDADIRIETHRMVYTTQNIILDYATHQSP